MAIICPTVTVETNDPHAFRTQLERVSEFASRIHIDLMDGKFAPTKSVNPIQVWWPETVEVDIHLMHVRPAEHLETLVSLHPRMVILHAESEGDIGAVMAHLQRFGIKVGIAFLQHTSIDTHQELVSQADHVLIFGGNLGHFGGTADLSLLSKVAEIKTLNPTAEIGWDGGIHEGNIKELIQGGIDVLDVGGFIQRSERPRQAFQKLESYL